MLFSFLISLVQFNLLLPEPQQKKIASKLDNLFSISDIQLFILLSFIKHILNQHVYLSLWSLTINLNSLNLRTAWGILISAFHGKSLN